MKPTRVTAIRSAETVAAVRFGDRAPFSRARVPVMPLSSGRKGTERPGQRPGRQRGEHDDADEGGERAQADRSQGIGALVAEALGQVEHGHDHEHEPDDQAGDRPPGPVDGDVAQGGDGRDPGGADSRCEGGEDGDG